MDSCSAPSIQRLFSSPRATRIITTVILGVALSGALSACIRVHVDMATSGTAVPLLSPSETIPGEGNLNGDDTIHQCDLKSQVPNAQQQTGSWCWAASSQLVVEYLTKKPAPQCELVSQTFGLTDPFLNCCEYLKENPIASNLGGTCDQGGWPELILNKKEIAFTKMVIGML